MEESIDYLLKEIQQKLTLEGKKRVFEENKELKSNDLKEWQDAEEFTRNYLIDKILFDILKVTLTAPKKFRTSDGTPRNVDYAIKYKKNRILLEVKPINADLYDKSPNGAVNQIKGIFRLAEARDKYNFGIATDGVKWIFINKEGKITDELDLRENFGIIKRYIIGEKKVSEKKQEDISKKFYEEYNDLLHGVKRISKNDCLVNSIKRVESDEDREEIAQILIDRLIFIKFLQSRGIIKDDILDFLYGLEEHELNLKLNQLFFEVMNAKKKERGSVDPHFDHIPYLNGSLFERLDVEDRNRGYRIKAGILQRIIEFLNEFRFIHRESIENQEDVIDPEILGYIFERAMTATDRKGTGAYYTPKEVTKYIAENTIYPTVIDKVNEFLAKDKGYKKTELLKNIDELFILPATTLNEIWNKIILNLTICDNACGSGAFLLAAADVLFDLNKRINDKLNLRTSDVGLKKLILKSLYGIDINPRAIEIAMLRLWLWLVESYKDEHIEPLPNIEYNLRVGNSLIGYVDIEQFGTTKLTLDDFVKPEETTKLLLNKFRKLKTKYRKAIGGEARQLRKDIEEIRGEIKRKLDKELYRDIASRKIEINKEEFLNLKPFHWGFEFYEVFDLDNTIEKRGFDIIIGNPPYVVRRLKSEEKEIIKKFYKEGIFGRFNIYGIFIQRSATLLCNSGFFGYINPKTFIADSYFRNLRKFILDNFEPVEILLIKDRRSAFVGVLQAVSILIMRRNKINLNNKIKIVFVEKKDGFRTNSFLKENIKLKRIILQLGDYPIFLIYPSKHIYDMFDLITKSNILLYNTIKEFKTGSVQWDLFKDYFIDKKDKKSKMLIWAENIQRYSFSESKYRQGKEWLKAEKKLDKKSDIKEYAIITQRVTADEQPRRIIATTVKSGKDFEEAYCENHTNYVTINTNNESRGNAVLAILNSKLMDFIFRRINSNTQVSCGELNYLPFPKRDLFEKYMEALNYFIIYLIVIKHFQDLENENLFRCIDREYLDALIFELYFKEKLNTDLLSLLEPYLKDISKLRDDTEKLQTIKQVMHKIQSNKKVIEEINKIKNHKWVKVIEES